MKRAPAIFLAGSLAATGVTLVALAVTIGRIGASTRQATAQYSLGVCFVVLLALALVFPSFAAADYRRLLRASLFMLSCGLLMILIFMGFMWMILSSGSAVTIARVFLPLYGTALCLTALATWLLHDASFRVYIYHVAREVPYAYSRYRT